MSAKSDRQAAREAVVKYHEIHLAALVERVGLAIDRFRDGQLDAFDVDQVLFQYSHAAKSSGSWASVRRSIGGSGSQ